MINRLVFDGISSHAVGLNEFGTHDLPEGSVSTLPLRYVLQGGQVVDQYAGLTDEEVVLEHASRQQRDLEEALRLESERLEAERRAAERNLTQLQFLRLLTLQERLALRATAKTDPIVEDFLDLLNKATSISLDDPDTVAGLNYMASKEYLTPARVEQIHSNIAP